MPTLAEALAWIALLISVAAALYARQSASEARRANRLALQPRMEKIHMDLLEFQDLFKGFMHHPLAHQVDEYSRRIVTPSAMYFPRHISKSVSETWDKFWYASREVMSRQDGENGVDIELLRDAQSSFHELASLLLPIIKSIEEHIRVADA